MTIELESYHVRYLKGVGPARAEALSRLGIVTLEDLLLHVPRDYLDWSTVTPTTSLAPGSMATVIGEIRHVERPSRGRRGKRVLRAVLDDGKGTVILTFFNAGYLGSKLAPGVRVVASGRVERFGAVTLTHPMLGFLDDDSYGVYHSGGILPVYPLTAGISQGMLRRIMVSALELCTGSIREVIPVEGPMARRGFGSREEVLRAVHVPSSLARARDARDVLALEELVLYQALLAASRARVVSEPGVAHRDARRHLPVFLSSLPYSLTDAQSRALDEILADMESPRPMRRLLQGDVGCGKTVVAAAACWVSTARSERQSVVLAPTEVLAEQHMRTLSALLEPLGVRCAGLTSGTDRASRRELAAAMQAGEPLVAVGTHALLEPDLSPSRLGLAVVDEQHKFGVRQRENMVSGMSPRPDMLVMSATPIPRTLAMTLYGDLDISVIDRMPPGRGTTDTVVVPPSADRRPILGLLLERLEAGERAYVIYPLREMPEEGQEDALRDATSAWETLRAGPLGRFGVGLLHGAMPSREKERVSRDFREGRLGVLVSTVVVEVGIDVPEATVMLVASAERFGLSQLHQLRGRIGRGGRRSLFVLLPGEGAGEHGLERVRILASTSNGFEIAERDLELRGPGELFGTRQHGLPSFRVADLASDQRLVTEARDLVRGNPSMLPELERDARRRFEAKPSPPV
ncbi:ATP-dependent DNA helicase RecG [Candidatus Fermentibacterales bacterium]|nr:ATP-dependent DNA helicase RecG [Candidatus Fermentibacterales bacterium]